MSSNCADAPVQRSSGLLPANRSVLLAATLIVLTGVVAAAADRRSLSVCADPDNMPFSNRRLQGFENKLAELVAGDLGAKLTYSWRPQRRGFIRRSLNAGECDLVMGVPSNFEMVLPTTPYYRSTYVFVSAKTARAITSFDDPALRDVTIGLPAFGDDGANAPPAHALARRGIVTNVVGFGLGDGDLRQPVPGRIVDAVTDRRVDLAILWGPSAGYFARRRGSKLQIVPVTPSDSDAARPFNYAISVGVRKGDVTLKNDVERILQRRRSEIRRLLEKFGVPMMEEPVTGAPSDDRRRDS